MDFKHIKRLIQLVESSDISSFSIEENEVKIEIQKERAAAPDQPYSVSLPPAPAAPLPAAPAAIEAPAPVAASPAPADDDNGCYVVTSPMVGTFYTSPSPEDPAFVSVGGNVQPGTVLCMVEAMKLFNEIESEVSGVVEKVLVSNGSPVEFGQKLFLIREQ